MFSAKKNTEQILALRAFYVIVLGLFASANAVADEPTAITKYHKAVQPILEQHCYDCHGYGTDEGGVAFDAFSSDDEIVKRKELWLAVLNNVRAGLMPPPQDVDTESRPTKDEIQVLVDWIKFDAFGIEPDNLDPGYVVPRRLNRVEYRNTIRDLLGYEFRADREFPPDDTGGGFDNNGEVLTVSTLLLEKYLAAAESIVNEAVPTKPPGIEKGEDEHTSDDKKKNKSRKKDIDRQRKRYERIFFDGPPPRDAQARDAYATKFLQNFATRAFRRPVEPEKVSQLVALASHVYSQPDKTFEQGVGRAMMAVLASPRFLFRIERPMFVAEGRETEKQFAPIDEHSLATRLSYFLWSSMPDEELTDLAERGQLRAELETQMARMLQDPKIETGLIRNFTGQWLQTRDIYSVEINGKAVLGKGAADGNRKTKYDFDGKIRNAMHEETERYFAYILKQNRSVLEFVDSDYAFLNEKLAKQYGIENVKGDKFRRVILPKDSYRGGVLTQGSVLAVTSNPTRTSPVKRGVFVLENILGTPPPPPPPNVSDLESRIEEFDGKEPMLGELLALHRQNEVCSSCHDRMDPIGLAFENFIPMGNWRDEEAGRPIDAAGILITGERFQDVRELKRVLASERRVDFYRCLTKKMFAYAIGRGLDYRDTHAVDTIVSRLVKDNGRIASLIDAIVQSAPFQKQGVTPGTVANKQ